MSENYTADALHNAVSQMDDATFLNWVADKLNDEWKIGDNPSAETILRLREIASYGLSPNREQRRA